MRTLLRNLANDDEEEGRLGRHGVLLASLVVLLVALPVGNALVGALPLFPLLLALVLIAAVLVNSHRRWVFILALLVGIGAVLGLAYSEVAGSGAVRVASQLLSVVLLGVTTLVMFISLLRADRVSLDTIVGGICVYLLIGLGFAVTFILMVELSPGAFVQGDQAIVRVAADASAHTLTLFYFSFVTITTLGYGDITPQGGIAQMLVIAEAMIGQLYLTIFVARLIASYVARDRIGEAR